MFNIGGPELIVLAVLALLVFGPESLPDIAKTVSRTLRAFRQASMDIQTEVREALEIETQQRTVAKAVVPPPVSATEDEVFGPVAKVAASAQVEPPVETEGQGEPQLDQEASPLGPEPASNGAVELKDSQALPASLDDTASTAEAADSDTDADFDDDGPRVPMSKKVRTFPAEAAPDSATGEEEKLTPVEIIS